MYYTIIFKWNFLFKIYHRSYVIQEEEKQKKVGIENPEIELLDNRELISDGQKILPQIVESYLSKSLPYAPQDCIL